MTGYARAHRSRWDHPLFKNKQEAAVWAWMCDTARFRAHSFRTQFGMVTLARGQLLVSQRMLADEFGMGRQQVRGLMSRMIASEMISENSTHSAARAGTIVTITNYERYQSDSGDYKTGATQGKKGKQPAANPRPTQGQPTREEREKGEERQLEEGSPSDSSIGKQIDPLVAEPSGSGLPAIDAVAAAFHDFQLVRNEFVPGARPLNLSAPRRSKLAARLKEVGGPDGWARVLATIRGSPFLRGETSRDGRFVAEIDWLLEPRNMNKLMEGNFDDRRSAIASQPTPVRGSPIDALSIAIAASGLAG